MQVRFEREEVVFIAPKLMQLGIDPLWLTLSVLVSRTS